MPSRAPVPVPLCPESPYAVWPFEGPRSRSTYEPLEPPVPPVMPFAFRFGMAGWIESIGTTMGSVSISAELGVRYRFGSLNLEVHGDPALDTAPVQDLGRASFSRISGAFLLCGHYGWFTGCGVADVGRIFFPHHVPPIPASAFYSAAGVRVGLEFPVMPPWLFLRVALDLRTLIQPLSYGYDHSAMFESTSPGAGLGLGVLAELPR